MNMMAVKMAAVVVVVVAGQAQYYCLFSGFFLTTDGHR
jgi:hypothetical protein